MTEVPLYSYQRAAYEVLSRRDGCAGLFMEMGTGKTRVAALYAVEHGNRILIVAPLAAIIGWKREFAKTGIAGEHDYLSLTTGTVAQKAKLLNAFEGRIVLVNYESYWREPLRKAIKTWAPDTVVLDEAHRIKHRGAKQSKFAHSFSQTAKRRIALTGTPMSNGLQDLYSMYRFIDPNVFGVRYDDFEWRYIIKGGFQGYQIVGYRNMAEARMKVAETSYQIARSDALELPERQDVMMPIELSPRARAKYDEFKKHAIAEIEGLSKDGKKVSGRVLARIVLTQLLRLQQITSGFATTDIGEVIDLSDEKLRIAVELSEDALEQGERVVIFCRFRHDMDRLKEKLYGKAVLFHGDLNEKQRERIQNAHLAGLIPVLICQIRAGSLSMDFTKASVAIYYSSGFSLVDFVQSKDRLHRHGQERKVTYYHLLVEKSVDERVYRELTNKADIAGNVISLDYARRLFS